MVVHEADQRTPQTILKGSALPPGTIWACAHQTCPSAQETAPGSLRLVLRCSNGALFLATSTLMVLPSRLLPCLLPTARSASSARALQRRGGGKLMIY